jgi:hypothetical protein
LIRASVMSGFFLKAAENEVVESRGTLRQEANPQILANRSTGTSNKKRLLGGMLSLEEIKEWADTVGAQSTSNLIKFCHNPAKPAHRAVTEIVFADGVDEYRVWIFREFNIIYVDAFHKGVEADTKLFLDPFTRRSLESISRILRRSKL